MCQHAVSMFAAKQLVDRIPRPPRHDCVSGAMEAMPVAQRRWVLRRRNWKAGAS